MSKGIRTLAIICLSTGLIGFTTSCKNGEATSETEAEVITPVTVIPVTFKTVTSTTKLSAVTTFMNKSIIRATTTGVIEKISIAPGDNIVADQQLFAIRTREAIAINNTAGSDTSLSFNGLINIVSHKDGIVSSISYQRGDFVQEGDELAAVSEQNSLVFILDVPFELDKYVEKNRKCIIWLPDDKQIEGLISGKLSEMEIESQTVRYIVKPTSTIRLPANLIASIGLIKSTDENAMVLPKQAILGDETQTEFWVMKLIDDSTAIKVIVTKGFENNEEVEITEPQFLPSDRILITGNYGLPDTARVAIIKE